MKFVLLGLGKATPIQFLDTPFGLWRAHRPREEKTCETKCKITHCECIKSRQRAVVSSGFVLVTPILSPQISSRELTQVVCKTLRRKGRAFQNIGKKTIFPAVKSALLLSVPHILMKCNKAHYASLSFKLKRLSLTSSLCVRPKEGRPCLPKYW